jgi:hypothetical protein
MVNAGLTNSIEGNTGIEAQQAHVAMCPVVENDDDCVSDRLIIPI